MVYQKYTAWRPSKGLKNAVTLTFKLVRAMDQTGLPCEFGSNPFSGSRDISNTNISRFLQTPVFHKKYN